MKLTEASRGLSMIRGCSCGWRGVAAAVVRRVLYFDRVYLRLHVAEVMQYRRWNQTHTLWYNIYLYTSITITHDSLSNASSILALKLLLRSYWYWYCVVSFSHTGLSLKVGGSSTAKCFKLPLFHVTQR